jgi:hypothetical protein
MRLNEGFSICFPSAERSNVRRNAKKLERDGILVSRIDGDAVRFYPVGGGDSSEPAAPPLPNRNHIPPVGRVLSEQQTRSDLPVRCGEEDVAPSIQYCTCGPERMCNDLNTRVPM